MRCTLCRERLKPGEERAGRGDYHPECWRKRMRLIADEAIRSYTPEDAWCWDFASPRMVASLLFYIQQHTVAPPAS